MADEPTTTAVSAAAATGSNPPVTHHYGEPQAALVAAPDSEGDEVRFPMDLGMIGDD